MSALGGEPVDCPVSGGCHRADTGNISIFAGCERGTFERILPLLTTMGRRILHTGPLGSASILKVVTNYLATANLLSCCEALVIAKAAGMDLNTTWEAIRISSGNSFVHETESQVILNGSRDISFTMDLVSKDIGLFQTIADRHGVPVELNPVMVEIFKDGEARYGPREMVSEYRAPPGGRHWFVDSRPWISGANDRRRTGGAWLRGRSERPGLIRGGVRIRSRSTSASAVSSAVRAPCSADSCRRTAAPVPAPRPAGNK